MKKEKKKPDWLFFPAYSSPSPGRRVSEQWHSTWIMLSHKSAVISKLSVTRESLMRSPLPAPCLSSLHLSFSRLSSVCFSTFHRRSVRGGFVFSSRRRGLPAFVCLLRDERTAPFEGGKGPRGTADPRPFHRVSASNYRDQLVSGADRSLV